MNRSKLFKTPEPLPPGSRTRMLPLFPAGAAHFRHWRSLRWFLLLVLPVLASSGAALIRGKGFAPALVVLVVGAAAAVALFVVLASGMISSNVGTYFRRTEPVRYWISVAVVVGGYLLLCAAGYFIEA